jgi:hypothetical protein
MGLSQYQNPNRMGHEQPFAELFPKIQGWGTDGIVRSHDPWKITPTEIFKEADWKDRSV